MSESQYYLCIRRHDGQEVRMRPGCAGETDLVKTFGERLPYVTTRENAKAVLIALITEQKKGVLV